MLQKKGTRHLECVESMSVEPVALKVIKKINGKLKYKINFYTTTSYDALHTFIQSYFDYACPIWHPNLTETNNKEHTSYAK